MKIRHIVGDGTFRSEYGITILAILLSCLFQLVGTAYFLFADLFGKKVCEVSLIRRLKGSTQLQQKSEKIQHFYSFNSITIASLIQNYQDRFLVMALWTVLHCIRVLWIVEPCHSAVTNVNNNNKYSTSSTYLT